jgi:hypothetical protein
MTPDVCTAAEDTRHNTRFVPPVLAIDPKPLPMVSPPFASMFHPLPAVVPPAKPDVTDAVSILARPEGRYCGSWMRPTTISATGVRKEGRINSEVKHVKEGGCFFYFTRTKYRRFVSADLIVNHHKERGA